MSVIIEIAGGSGSGKSTLAKNLCRELENATLITHDDYYRDVDHDAPDFNYDHPSAFETELLLTHLKLLKSGASVDAPIYDYSLHARSREKRPIDPTPIIIVEGILVLESEGLREIADLKIFVDTPEEDRLSRRIRRDTRDRGRTEQSVRDQFYKTVKPMHELYVEPEKDFADIIVKNGGEDEATVRAICERIKLLPSGATAK